MNFKGSTKRLAKSDYKRPKKTKQDMMTEQDIEEALDGYVEVEDMSQVPINTHIRYFTIETNKKTGKTTKKFRLGGFLLNKSDYKKYVVLTNGKNSWSVNSKKSIFYRKQNAAEVREEMDSIIDEYRAKNKLYKKEIKRLRKLLEHHGIDYY